MTNHLVASFAQAVADHYGLQPHRWPASAEHVAPLFAIIVSALGPDGAGAFVEAQPAAPILPRTTSAPEQTTRLAIS